jgi:hypothetical protein
MDWVAIVAVMLLYYSAFFTDFQFDLFRLLNTAWPSTACWHAFYAAGSMSHHRSWLVPSRRRDPRLLGHCWCVVSPSVDSNQGGWPDTVLSCFIATSLIGVL